MWRGRGPSQQQRFGTGRTGAIVSVPFFNLGQVLLEPEAAAPADSCSRLFPLPAPTLKEQTEPKPNPAQGGTGLVTHVDVTRFIPLDPPFSLLTLKKNK